jgi:hypothetical protein
MTTNGLSAGDKVIDFRGEQRGTVTAIYTDRAPKSDRVVVNGREYYCTVWSKI